MGRKRPLSLSLPTTYWASRKVSFLDRNVPRDPNNVSGFGAKGDTTRRHFGRFLRVTLHDWLASRPERYSKHDSLLPQSNTEQTGLSIAVSLQSPSSPMASQGHPFMASLHSSFSSLVSVWSHTYVVPSLSSNLK